MITATKKAEPLEAVRRNGQHAFKGETLQTKSGLGEQAEALNELAQRFAVAFERLVAASELLLLENTPEVELGIDLTAELRRYELLLIQRALRKTQGCQVRAAALLRLKPTTLNSKLKAYAGRNGKSKDLAKLLFLS
jgi:DNA-binding NtrC family response regulator